MTNWPTSWKVIFVRLSPHQHGKSIAASTSYPWLATQTMSIQLSFGPRHGPKMLFIHISESINLNMRFMAETFPFSGLFFSLGFIGNSSRKLRPHPHPQTTGNFSLQNCAGAERRELKSVLSIFADLSRSATCRLWAGEETFFFSVHVCSWWKPINNPPARPPRQLTTTDKSAVLPGKVRVTSLCARTKTFTVINISDETCQNHTQSWLGRRRRQEDGWRKKRLKFRYRISLKLSAVVVVVCNLSWW